MLSFLLRLGLAIAQRLLIARADSLGLPRPVVTLIAAAA
jgi:hypothetical protein